MATRRRTISFTIDEEQLLRVDELSERLDRDRSSTLRRIIEIGLPIVDASRNEYVRVVAKSQPPPS